MSLGAVQNLQDCLALLVEALLTRSKILVGTALPLNYDHHATTKFFNMYCTCGTECLSHTPGNHTVCTIRTQLEINWIIFTCQEEILGLEAYEQGVLV